jgi:anti-sigma B factor antagonist
LDTHEFTHLRLSMVDDVVLIEVVSKDLQGPALAQELRSEMGLVVSQEWAKKLLVDLGHTQFLSSTGFGVLFDFVNRVKRKGHEAKFCNLEPAVRLGADIIGLGKVAEIHDSRTGGLEAFAKA